MHIENNNEWIKECLVWWLRCIQVCTEYGSQCKTVSRADQPASAMPRIYNADPNGYPSFFLLPLHDQQEINNEAR